MIGGGGGAEQGGHRQHEGHLAGDRPMAAMNTTEPSSHSVRLIIDRYFGIRSARNRAFAVASGSSSVSSVLRRCQRNTGRRRLIDAPTTNDRNKYPRKIARLVAGRSWKFEPIGRWQAEPEEAQHQQCADDVGLQQAEGEHRPGRAGHPADEISESAHASAARWSPTNRSGPQRRISNRASASRRWGWHRRRRGDVG